MPDRFRSVWPNGVVAYVMDDKEEFFQDFDENNNQYEKMGIPKEYRPHVEVQTLEVIEHPWESFEKWRIKQNAPKPTSGPEYVNQVDVTRAKHSIDVPQLWQIEQVKKKKFGYGDPCILCGTKFQMCPHNTVETEMYVEYIKKGPWYAK